MTSDSLRDFCAKLAPALDVETIDETTVLPALPTWDSLSMLGMTAVIDSDYGVTMNADDYAKVTTAADLWELIQQRRGR